MREKSLENLYEQVCNERSYNGYYTILRYALADDVQNFINSQEDIFIQSNKLYTPEEMSTEPNKDWVEYQIDVEGNVELSHERQTFDSPGGWWSDSGPEAKVDGNQYFTDENGNIVPNKYLMIAGTPIELTSREDEKFVEKIIGEM